jgi:hypothetical protein
MILELSFYPSTPLSVENYVTYYEDQDFEPFIALLRPVWLLEPFPGLHARHGALLAIYNLQRAAWLAGPGPSARRPSRGDLSS